MGPIETGLRQRAHEIHERLRNTHRDGDQFKIAELTAENQLLKSEISRLKQSVKELKTQLMDVSAKLVFERTKSTYKHIIPKQVIHKIIKFVSEKEHVHILDICGPARTGNYTLPRQIAAYLAIQYPCNTSTQIGRQLGGRDHSTVLHAIKVITRKMETDQVFHAKIMKYREELGDIRDGTDIQSIRT